MAKLSSVYVETGWSLVVGLPNAPRTSSQSILVQKQRLKGLSHLLVRAAPLL